MRPVMKNFTTSHDFMCVSPVLSSEWLPSYLTYHTMAPTQEQGTTFFTWFVTTITYYFSLWQFRNLAWHNWKGLALCTIHWSARGSTFMDAISQKSLWGLHVYHGFIVWYKNTQIIHAVKLYKISHMLFMAMTSLGIN